MTDPAPILRLSGVRFRWPGADAFRLAVSELTLARAETLLLLGPSGSGKSTLLSLLCGTITARGGVVEVAGQDLSTLSPAARDRHRGEAMGILFQQFNLLPFASVADNIALPLRFAPSRRARVPDPNQEAARLCAALDLPRGILARPARLLSVGQQQRVAAARALIGAPPLIIADEPTSSLDAAAQSAFLDLLFAQAKTNGTAALMVSHDERLAPQFDRVLHLTEITQ